MMSKEELQKLIDGIRSGDKEDFDIGLYRLSDEEVEAIIQGLELLRDKGAQGAEPGKG